MSSAANIARWRSLGPRSLRGHWFRLIRDRLWRYLPRPLRRSMLRLTLGQSRAPLAQGAVAAEPLCIAGILTTATGIGEGGRLASAALASLGYEVLNVDVSALLEAAPGDGVGSPPLEAGPGTVVLHFNPDNLPAVLTLLGRERLRGKRIIGYWAWELDHMPAAWRPALAEVDEIWVPSGFVARSIRPFTAKPVRVVPHPVAVGGPGRARRAEFGTEGVFTALTMFSFRAFSRKNPLAAVRAFRSAFGNHQDRLLILKCHDVHEAPRELRELESAIGDAPNIRIDRRRLGSADRLDLLASVDVLLSLHRSEGFGLVLAEAMHAGTAVIATRWSGNLDFMDESNALLVPYRMAPAIDSRSVYPAGGRWAEPDEAAAADYLRALAEAPADYAGMRERAARSIGLSLGLDAFARAVAGALPPRPPS